ncbi:MAG: SDR family oxidoreductase [Pseudobdellovibrionaceae bacterium]
MTVKIEKKFSNKVAVVTGGTRGIGRAVSIELAKEGAMVFALYARDRASADVLSEEAKNKNLNIICLRGDLTRPEKFQSLTEELLAKTDHVDFIIHCAASGVHKEATQLTHKHLAWTFDINVFAIHNLIQVLIEKMPAGGRIVGVTSSGGTRVIPYYAAVGSSKGALESLFRHYASELAPKGIAVNCVCPGLVLTDAVEAFPDKDSRTDKTIQATPSGQLTTPEDVANVVSFLCDKRSSQIVGQTLVIDGGKTLSS